MSQPPEPQAAALPTFEQALAELETLVQSMESGKLTLEDSVLAYQRGVELLRHCQDTLAAAEQRIKVLEAGQVRDYRPGQAGAQ